MSLAGWTLSIAVNTAHAEKIWPDSAHVTCSWSIALQNHSISDEVGEEIKNSVVVHFFIRFLELCSGTHEVLSISLRISQMFPRRAMKRRRPRIKESVFKLDVVSIWMAQLLR